MKLIESSQYTLKQLIDLLSNLESVHYVHPVRICNGSTIGMHVRHIVELYQCLLKGLGSGFVNYDDRLRNRQMETDIKCAMSKINDVKESIVYLPNDALLRIIENQTITDDETSSNAVQSTLQRELMYNLEHCIHHMAIIAMCVRSEFPHVTIHPDFGKAYSTIRFEKSNQVCVR